MFSSSVTRERKKQSSHNQYYTTQSPSNFQVTTLFAMTVVSGPSPQHSPSSLPPSSFILIEDTLNLHQETISDAEYGACEGQYLPPVQGRAFLESAVTNTRIGWKEGNRIRESGLRIRASRTRNVTYTYLPLTYRNPSNCFKELIATSIAAEATTTRALLRRGTGLPGVGRKRK